MKTRAWMLGALLAAGVGGVAFAEANENRQTQGTQQGQQASQSKWQAEGRVIEVDEDDVKISRSDGANIEFDVNRDTTIRVNGANGQLRDLQRGAEVRVRFDLSDDDTIAQEIEVIRPSSTPSKR